MQKNILVNVYDTDGLVHFLNELGKKYECKIFSAEENEKFLSENGFSVICMSEFSEEYSPDMVICNFFPAEKYENRNADKDEIIESINAQALTLLTMAAKNHHETLIVSSKNDYEEVLKRIHEGRIDEEFLFSSAQNGLAKIAEYTTGLAVSVCDKDKLFVLSGVKDGDLVYGENPHQKASLYVHKQVNYEVLNGKQLSYNNFLDMSLAVSIVSEFYDVCAVAITKHSMPCGVALGSTVAEACQKAVDCDPVSSFEGIAAFSGEIDEKLAKNLSSLMLEIIIAPDFSEKALEILKQKDLKIIKLNTPLKDYRTFVSKEIKVTPFGILVQEADKSQLEKESFNVVSKKKPTTEMVEDMIFAWKVSKHTRSDSAVVVKDLKTVGICQGETARVDAIEKALDKACENSKDAILALDGFVSGAEGIHAAIQGRVAGIIQPGFKDKEVIKIADKYELVMITTGIRQFRNQ